MARDLRIRGSGIPGLQGRMSGLYVRMFFGSRVQTKKPEEINR